MGGRGASSGVSVKGNKYGSQYRTVLEHDNIKFVTNVMKNQETLMETMTSGRIYVQVGDKDIVRIVFMDEENTRNKVIEKDKKSKEWHVHHGYLHRENSENTHDPLTDSDKVFLENVKELWHNHIRRL